jgi:hypothetical protein
MASTRQVVETVILIVAIVIQAAAIYGITDAESRVIVGALALAVIMAVTVRLAKVEVRSQPVDQVVPTKRYQRRRYVLLRNTLERFIDEVRLLNRVAVDVQRGFRSRDSAELELENIETRLGEMVKEFRAAAAVEAEQG